MKLIDKYILKKFLGVYLFTVLIITSVVLIIHISDNAERLMRAEVSTGEIVSYYLDFLPWMANSITPLTVFIATVFVNAKLATRLEIVAMLSNAISFRRFLMPYLIGGVLITAISFVLGGWVIPDINKSKTAFEIAYLNKKAEYNISNIHMQIAKDTYLYVRGYDSLSNTGTQFTLERILGTELVEKLSARDMTWLEDQQKWRLSNWRSYSVGDLEENVIKGSFLDTALNVSPKDFEAHSYNHEGLTMTELDSEILKLHSRGALNVVVYEVEKYMRYALPFAALILTVLGVFISSKKARGGIGFQIALGFLLCFVYIIFYTLSKAIAENGGFSETIDAPLSVWLPNAVFATITVIIYRYVPR